MPWTLQSTETFVPGTYVPLGVGIGADESIIVRFPLATDEDILMFAVICFATFNADVNDLVFIYNEKQWNRSFLHYNPRPFITLPVVYCPFKPFVEAQRLIEWYRFV